MRVISALLLLKEMKTGLDFWLSASQCLSEQQKRDEELTLCFKASLVTEVVHCLQSCCGVSLRQRFFSL